MDQQAVMTIRTGVERATVREVFRGILGGFEDGDGVIRGVRTADLLAQLVNDSGAATMLAALEIVLFAVTKDADTNGGKVDRAGIAGTCRDAIRACRGGADVEALELAQQVWDLLDALAHARVRDDGMIASMNDAPPEHYVVAALALVDRLQAA
jgi:hypothetical protein